MGMGIYKRQSGFTIIEVTLVLAISAGLGIFILITAMSSINQQRYQDAVMTVLGSTQQEYVAATRVVNGQRPATNQMTCDESGRAIDVGTEGGTARGTSECIIIGRAINITPAPGGGTRIQTGDITAAPRTSVIDESGVIANFQSYNMHLNNVLAGSTTTAPWSTGIYVMNGGVRSENVGVLILRSPLTGGLTTFVNKGSVVSDSNIATMLTEANMAGVTLCIDSRGLSSQPVNAVRIQAGASGPNSVTQQLEGNGC